MKKVRVVFLDRDGTIIKKIPYCSKVEDIKLLPKVPKAIKLLNSNNYKVIVITNQSGIARSFLTIDTLDQMHDKIRTELAKSEAYIDAVYYCPHHPDENCECRKPKIGLLLQASKDFNIDFGQSYVIGDQQMDIEAGKSAGCKTSLVSHKRNLLEVSRWIINRSERQ